MLDVEFPYRRIQLKQWIRRRLTSSIVIAFEGLSPRVFFLREMRKFSREIIVRMRDEDK